MFNLRDHNCKMVKVVTFLLGTETYGIDINKIMEVLQFQKVEKKYDPPDFIEGVIDLRDRVVPIMDLKNRLDINGESGKRKKVMILDIGSHPLGVIVDDISKVLSIDVSHYDSMPDDVMRVPEKSCISRIARNEDDLIMIISPERILTGLEKEKLKEFKKGIKKERKNATASKGSPE